MPLSEAIRTDGSVDECILVRYRGDRVVNPVSGVGFSVQEPGVTHIPQRIVEVSRPNEVLGEMAILGLPLPEHTMLAGLGWAPRRTAAYVHERQATSRGPASILILGQVLKMERRA
jgi:hypothetical protein